MDSRSSNSGELVKKDDILSSTISSDGKSFQHSGSNHSSITESRPPGTQEEVAKKEFAPHKPPARVENKGKSSEYPIYNSR